MFEHVWISLISYYSGIATWIEDVSVPHYMHYATMQSFGFARHHFPLVLQHAALVQEGVSRKSWNYLHGSRKTWTCLVKFRVGMIVETTCLFQQRQQPSLTGFAGALVSGSTQKASQICFGFLVSTCCLQECDWLIRVTISLPPSAKNLHSHVSPNFQAVLICSIFSELVKLNGQNPHPKGAESAPLTDFGSTRRPINQKWLMVRCLYDALWQCLAHFTANMSMGKTVCSMGSPPEFRRFIIPSP